MEKIRNFLAKYYLLIIIAVSFLAIRALLVPGFYGASDDLHPAWLYEMDRVIKLWQIPPRFVPDLSFGFGYPLFNFVFPLPFYAGELFHLLGFSLVDSVKIVFLLSIPLSMIFMYKFLREFMDETLSLAGAVLYGFTPYRATDIYVRGAIGEIVGFVFLPLIALSVLRLTTEGGVKKRWIAIGGLSLAGLILTHNITAYMFLPFIVILGLLRRKNIFPLIASFILGLSLSIYFWLPAILDSTLMKYDTVFNFIDHFPTIKQLITPYFGYGASVAGPYDGMSFFIGTINLIILALGIVISIIKWRQFSKGEKTILAWGFLVFATAVFMMNFRSTFVWRLIPLLPYFQFPWRFLIMTTFITPIFLITFKYIKWGKPISLIILIMTILLNDSYFGPHDFLGRKDDYYLNRYIPVPVASDEYKKTQEEYLRLPKNTQSRPTKNYPRIEISGAVPKNVIYENEMGATFSTDSVTTLSVNYNKYYFPGWKVLIDGKEVKVGAGYPFGQVSFKIPQGVHKTRVFFSETRLKLFLDFLSVLSLVITLSLLFKRENIRKNEEL